MWNPLQAVIDTKTNAHKARVYGPSIRFINEANDAARAQCMRVGPGTDAVVFKTWDTTHTECEI